MTGMVRSFGFDKAGNTLVGTNREFGMLLPDPTGSLRYQSLMPLFPRQYQKPMTVWGLTCTGDYAYGFTQKFIFRYHLDPKTPKDQRMYVYPSGEDVYVIDGLKGADFVTVAENGVYRAVGDSLVAEPLLSKTNEYIIRSFLPRDDGRHMVLTDAKGFALLDEEAGQIDWLKTDIDAWLAANQAYHCTYTRDPHTGQYVYAIGTSTGGIAVINEDGKLLHLFNKQSGLRHNNVFNLYFDREHQLWASLSDGIAKINLFSHYTALNLAHGLTDRIYDLFRQDGRLYLATEIGIYTISSTAALATPLAGQADIPQPQVTRFPGINSTQCWKILPLGKEDLLIAGGNQGVFRLRNGRIAAHYASYSAAMKINISSRDSSILYVARYLGLEVLRIKPNSFESLGWVKALNGIDCRHIAEQANGKLWVGTTSEGFFQIDFQGKLGQPGGVEQAQVRRYDKSKGLKDLTGCYVFKFGQGAQDELYFTSQYGIYRYDQPRDRMIELREWGLHFDQPRHQNPVLFKDRAGNIWLPKSLTIMRPRPEGKMVQDSTTLRGLSGQYFCFWEDPDGTTWMGGENDIVRIYSKAEPILLPFATRLQEVFSSEQRRLLYSGESQGSGANVIHRATPLPYTANSLLFQWSASTMQLEKQLLYSYRLEGFDQEWSAWTPDTRKEYTNLREGNYVFRVKSRHPLGMEGIESSYRFELQPPWHRTWWAMSIWIIGILLVFVGGIRWNTRRLYQEKTALEHLFNQRQTEVGLIRQTLLDQETQLLAQKAALSELQKEVTAQREALTQLSAKLQDQHPDNPGS